LNVLALDLGTQTGWSLLSSGVITSGSVGFGGKPLEGYGVRFLRFRRWLVELKGGSDLHHVVFEDVKFHPPGQVYAAHIYGGLEATLCAWAESHAVPYSKVSVGTIKKSWTGNGAAKKPDMIEEARRRGFTVRDDNEADALAILHWAIPVLKAAHIAAEREVADITDKPF
jgi:hypothetical protein